MRCFKCKQLFESASNLFLHFRLIHGLDKNDIYKCNENDCVRIFSNINSFRKHIYSNHSNCSSSIQIANGINIKSKVNSSCNISDQAMCDVIDIKKSSFDNTSIPAVYNKINMTTETAKFICALYNNSLVPRNVVQFIVETTSPFLKDLRFLINENAITLLFCYLESICFNEHFCSYEVRFENKKNKIQSFNELPNKTPCMLIQKDVTFYVQPRFLI